MQLQHKQETDNPITITITQTNEIPPGKDPPLQLYNTTLRNVKNHYAYSSDSSTLEIEIDRS